MCFLKDRDNVYSGAASFSVVMISDCRTRNDVCFAPRYRTYVLKQSRSRLFLQQSQSMLLLQQSQSRLFAKQAFFEQAFEHLSFVSSIFSCGTSLLAYDSRLIFLPATFSRCREILRCLQTTKKKCGTCLAPPRTSFLQFRENIDSEWEYQGVHRF